MKRKALFAAFAVLFVGLIYACSENNGAPPPPAPAHVAVPTDDDARIAAAYRDRVSDIVVETRGVVTRLLPDDNEGSRHQRFIVRLRNELSLLVSHNIDLAPRIDGLRVGDTVAVRGEYEWNNKGGVIHWTHHDPRGRHPGGWIRHEGRIYE